MSWAGLGRDPNDKPPHSHNFQWIKEAQKGENTSENAPATGSLRAGTLRYAGHCYFQAAYQAGNHADFREKIKLAGACFQDAADATQNPLLKPRLSGLSSYCQAILEPDPSRILTRLLEAHDTLTRSWVDGGKEAAHASPTLGLELVHVTNDLMYYDQEVARRLSRLQPALGVSKESEDILPNLDKNLSTLLITELADLHVHGWIHLPTADEREAEGKRALELFERLRKEMSATQDPRCAVGAFALQLESADLLPERPLIIDRDAVLPWVESTKDKVAIGSFLAASLRSRLEPLRDAEDPRVAKEMLALSEKEALEALSQLQAFQGLRRFRTSPGYVTWTRGDILAMYGRLYAHSHEERLRLAEEAVRISHQVGESGPPMILVAQYSNLGYYLFQRALLEQSPEKRKTSLEEAWKAGLGYQESTHRFYPHWDSGDADHYRLYGSIRREQAKAGPQKDAALLLEAVEKYQTAVNCVQRILNSPLAGDPNLRLRILGGYQYELGSTQVELYTRTRDSQILDSALSNLRSSAEAASKLSIPTRAAEALDRIGAAYLLGGQFEQASKAFSEAANRYETASEKYPGLAQVFQARSLLMKARAATSTARGEYNRGAFSGAASQYREASRLLQETPTWQGLAALYDAWALLADAENHSQSETSKATQDLESAVGKFVEAEKMARSQNLPRTEGEEQTVEAQRRLLAQGKEYAEARLILEKARMLERHGEPNKSLDQLAEAARKFETMSKAAEDAETQDMMENNALVCKASRVMLQAEEQLNPDLYAEASALFQKAKQNSKTKQVATLAGGWAACCKSLELGLRYRESSDYSTFQTMKKQLTSALGFFLDAGATSTASWLKATGCMFDAMAHLAEGEASLSAAERESQYQRAEEQLRAAADLFEKADYPGRKEDAIRFLKSTIEQRRAITARIIQEAPVTQSVTSITGRTGSQELLLGSAAVAAPAIHAALRGPEGPVPPGTDARISLTVLNPGQSMLRLVSVENLEIPGAEIKTETGEYAVQDGKLELKGKRLSPLEVFELPLQIRPRRPGEHRLQPHVKYLNLQGELRREFTPTLTLRVAEVGIRSWLRGPGR